MLWGHCLQAQSECGLCTLHERLVLFFLGVYKGPRATKAIETKIELQQIPTFVVEISAFNRILQGMVQNNKYEHEKTYTSLGALSRHATRSYRKRLYYEIRARKS